MLVRSAPLNPPYGRERYTPFLCRISDRGGANWSNTSRVRSFRQAGPNNERLSGLRTEIWTASILELSFQPSSSLGRISNRVAPAPEKKSYREPEKAYTP